MMMPSAPVSYTHLDVYKRQVLTWHQLTEDVSGSATISPETFRKQIQALSDAGCNTISLEQLRDYVYNLSLIHI